MVSSTAPVSLLLSTAAARRVHHVEVGQRLRHPAERRRLRERVHGAQDRVLDEVHRPLLSGSRNFPELCSISRLNEIGGLVRDCTCTTTVFDRDLMVEFGGQSNIRFQSSAGECRKLGTSLLHPQSTGGVVSCCDKDGCNTGATIVSASPAIDGPALSAGSVPGAPLVFAPGQQQGGGGKHQQCLFGGPITIQPSSGTQPETNNWEPHQVDLP